MSSTRIKNMLSFYKFKNRLVQTASFYNGTCIRAYTSKQCGLCGRLNDKLGASELFICENCGLTSDRDVHAARNILLKYLGKKTGFVIPVATVSRIVVSSFLIPEKAPKVAIEDPRFFSCGFYSLYSLFNKRLWVFIAHGFKMY